jgi:ketosteroid isomerase-like protein
MTATLSASDRLDIHELLARYAWALDTGDESAFIDCFTQDAELVWDVFDEPGIWRGHAALQRFVAYFRSRPESAGRQHHVSNVVLSADAAGARAKAYVLVALRDGAGPHRLNVMGHYDDLLRIENGAWRIAQRCIRDWSGSVLARIAGQDGARVPRPRPAALDGLWATR